MRTYQIDYTYVTTAVCEVEANSEAEAKEKFNNGDYDGECDSFEDDFEINEITDITIEVGALEESKNQIRLNLEEKL